MRSSFSRFLAATALTCSLSAMALAQSAIDGTNSGVAMPLLESSAAHNGNLSFLRFRNDANQPATFTVRVVGSPSGVDYTDGRAYTITVPPGAAPQKSLVDIEAAVGQSIMTRAGDSYTTAYVQSDQPNGSIQHVMFNPVTGYFENLSICRAGAALDASGVNRFLGNVHTSRLAGYRSTIYIHNPEGTSRTVRGRVHDAVTGVQLGTFARTLRGNEIVEITMPTLEPQIGFVPSTSQVHVNIRFETADALPLTALFGHFVRQISSNADFNLTTACALGASSGDDAAPDNMGTNRNIAVGTTLTGNIEKVGDYDWFRVELEANKSYTVDVKGDITGSGTLGDPFLQIYDSTEGLVAENDDGPTSVNPQVVFRPLETGTYYLVVRQAFDAATGTYEISIVTP